LRIFEHTIKNDIHARPIGRFIRELKDCPGAKVYVRKNTEDAKDIDATSPMRFMSFGLKKGDVVTVKICGGDEAIAEEKLKKVMDEYF
jgi:phosphotransferase system HPr (HPr) family protein